MSKAERVRQTIEWANYDVPAALWDDLKALPFSTDDPEVNARAQGGLAERGLRSQIGL